MKLKLTLTLLITALLAALFIPWTTSCGTHSKVSVDVQILGDIVVLYHEKYQKLPPSLSLLANDNEFVARLPKDPWGYNYQYGVSADGFAVWSQGAMINDEHIVMSVYVKDKEGYFMPGMKVDNVAI